MALIARFRRLVAKARARIRWFRATEAQKRQVAVHEAGHVLAAWLLPTFGEMVEATVLPTGDFRGYTLASHALSDPPEPDQVRHLMTMGMAGAAAERLMLGRCDDGSADDMIHAFAWWLTGEYGMPHRSAVGVSAACMMRMLGPDPVARFVARAMMLPVVAAAVAEAVELLRPRMTELSQVAELLRRKKTIGHRHLERLLGPRPA